MLRTDAILYLRIVQPLLLQAPFRDIVNDSEGRQALAIDSVCRRYSYNLGNRAMDSGRCRDETTLGDICNLSRRQTTGAWTANEL